MWLLSSVFRPFFGLKKCIVSQPKFYHIFLEKTRKNYPQICGKINFFSVFFMHSYKIKKSPLNPNLAGSARGRFRTTVSANRHASYFTRYRQAVPADNFAPPFPQIVTHLISPGIVSLVIIYTSNPNLALCCFCHRIVKAVIPRLRSSRGNPFFPSRYYGLPRPVCGLVSQ